MVTARRRAVRTRRRALLARCEATALAVALEEAARELRAGQSLRSALMVAPGPIPPALALARGEPLDAVLTAWARRSRTPPERGAATAAAMAALAGGSSALALDTAASSLRESAASAAEARAQAATAIASAIVVGALPIAFLAFTLLFDRRTTSVLIGTGPGLVCLSVGVTLDVVGLTWMRWLIRSASRP